MPCFYTGSAEGDRALAEEENAKELQNKLTKMTRIACKLARELESNNLPLPEGTKSWWNKHKKLDARDK